MFILRNVALKIPKNAPKVDNITVRCFKQLKQNPGINRRAKVITKNENELQEIDEFESDFMSLETSHREHVSEINAMKEREKYQIVQRKYFKETHPNFLTWADKTQIKYLYNSDPEEWSLEKLSEGFPATPEVIKAIVKSNWTKSSETKIKNHDKGVQQNWNKFKRGQFNDLPADLKEHLAKFTNRALNFKQSEPPPGLQNTLQTQKPKLNIKNEFSQIISSYHAKNVTETNENRLIDANFSKQNEEEEEQFQEKPSINHLKSSKRVQTLDNLKQNLENQVSKGKTVPLDDLLIVQSSQNVPEINQNEKTSELTEFNIDKYKTGIVEIRNKSEKDVAHLVYPDKIKIPLPRNKISKKCVYKLNDCYYDYDGEFLYRVPGMD